MPLSKLTLIKRSVEFCPRAEVGKIPHGIRGMYVLYRKRKHNDEKKFDIVYVGIAFGKHTAGVHSRIKSHENKDKNRRGKLWTHFSIFEV
jgi:hypothetical protein